MSFHSFACMAIVAGVGAFDRSVHHYGRGVFFLAVFVLMGLNELHEAMGK